MRTQKSTASFAKENRPRLREWSFGSLDLWLNDSLWCPERIQLSRISCRLPWRWEKAPDALWNMEVPPVSTLTARICRSSSTDCILVRCPTHHKSIKLESQWPIFGVTPPPFREIPPKLHCFTKWLCHLGCSQGLRSNSWDIHPALESKFSGKVSKYQNGLTRTCQFSSGKMLWIRICKLAGYDSWLANMRSKSWKCVLISWESEL